MNKNLLEGNVSLTRFFGGKEWGICYQITNVGFHSEEFVTLTKREALDIALAILKDFRSDKYGIEERI